MKKIFKLMLKEAAELTTKYENMIADMFIGITDIDVNISDVDHDSFILKIYAKNKLISMSYHALIEPIRVYFRNGRKQKNYKDYENLDEALKGIKEFLENN